MTFLGLSPELMDQLTSPLVLAPTLFTVALTSLYGYHWHLSYSKIGEAPIHWTWVPILGSAIAFGMEPIKYLQDNAEKYGDIFGLVLAGYRTFVIADSHSQGVVLKSNKNMTSENFHNSVVVNFFGASIHTMKCADYDLWRKWFMMHLYSDGGLHKLTQRMQKYLLDKVENGPNIGNGVPLYNFVGKQILQASVAALFNDQVADTDGIFEAFLEFDKVMPMCLGGAHISYFSKGYNALKFLDESVAKTFMNNWCDLLNTIANRWIQIRSEGRSDPKDKIRVLLPYFWASVSNSMPATFWMLYYLLKDPDLLEKVIAEVDRVVADGGEGQNLTTEHMASMHLVDACITEALRLHSGSLIMRDVLSPCSLVLASGRSYNFRKGDRVCIFPTMTNLDPEIFPEPNRYNPLRWLEGVTTEEEKAAKSMGKITLVKDNKELASGTGFIPFGAGPTLCPGRRFFRNEVKAFLVFFLTKYSIQFATEADGKVDPGYDGSRAGIGMFPPKRDVMVTITERKK